MFKANVPLLHFILINMAVLLTMRRHDKRWEKSKLSYCKVKTFASCRPLNKIDLFVGNKAIGSTSKRRWQENKAPHVLQKTNISYPLIHTRTCWDRGEGGGKDMFVFRKIWRTFFFVTSVLRFAILRYYRRISCSIISKLIPLLILHFIKGHQFIRLNRIQKYLFTKTSCSKNLINLKMTHLL